MDEDREQLNVYEIEDLAQEVVDKDHFIIFRKKTYYGDEVENGEWNTGFGLKEIRAVFEYWNFYPNSIEIKECKIVRG